MCDIIGCNIYMCLSFIHVFSDLYVLSNSFSDSNLKWIMFFYFVKSYPRRARKDRPPRLICINRGGYVIGTASVNTYINRGVFFKTTASVNQLTEAVG